MTTRQLLEQRKLTRTIGEIISADMKQYVATLTPVLRPPAVFGEHIQGGTKEPVKNADQAFRELQDLYGKVLARAPFLHLPKELTPPLLPMTASVELSPWEYAHLAKTEHGSKTIAVTCPYKAVLMYSGYGPQRLRELLADRNRSEGVLQQFVLHYVAMKIVAARQTGFAQILKALHFSIGSAELPSFGALPITYITSDVATRLPADDVVVESTELSGKDAFEELVDIEGIAALRDPLQERLAELLRTQA